MTNTVFDGIHCLPRNRQASRSAFSGGVQLDPGSDGCLACDTKPPTRLSPKEIIGQMIDGRFKILGYFEHGDKFVAECPRRKFLLGSREKLKEISKKCNCSSC